MIARRLVVGLAVLALPLAGWWMTSRPVVAYVRSDAALAGALRGAPEGATIRLLPGTYEGFAIRRPLVVEGSPGSLVHGQIDVLADGVQVRDLRVMGADSGISVRDVTGVVLDRVTVTGAVMQGIEVVDGNAVISDCSVSSPGDPMAQGIEVRNAAGLGRTVVRGCSISGGQEGLVSHVSRAEFVGNTVTGTTLRAISVTEMSEGLVQGNRIDGVVGIGLYCGDMSHCEFDGNTVTRVSRDPNGVRSRAGFGAVAWYYSTMRLSDNRFDVAAPEPAATFMGSITTDRFPLALWPPGWRGAIPGLGVTAIALAGVALVRLALEPFVRRRRRKVGRPIAERALWVLAIGFLIQSFHMLEHVVQAIQVYVLQSQQRSGLLGSVFDNEWVHFVFNWAVIVFLGWAFVTVWRSAPTSDRLGRAAAWLGGALVIQSWHVLEHSVRIVQHLSLGLSPAPGILGRRFDLVWLHFGLNVAVYGGLVIGTALVVRPYAAALLRARVRSMRMPHAAAGLDPV